MFNVSAWHWHLSVECVRLIIYVAAEQTVSESKG